MNSKGVHRHDIDGLRAVAVIPVVLYHAGLGFPGGFVGVDVFFVISGYLITGLILKDLNDKSFSMTRFWERRIRRILPPLFVVTVATLLLAYLLLLPDDFRAFGGSLASQAVMSANIWFWNEAGYFDAPSLVKPLLHLWSLSIEEQFYLLLPLVLAAIYPFGKKSVAFCLSISCLLSLSLCVYASYYRPYGNYYLLPTRAWELLLGCALAAQTIDGPKTNSRRITKEIVAVGGLGAIIFSAVCFDEQTRFPGIAALLPTLGSAAVIWSGISGDNSSIGGTVGASADETIVRRLLSIRSITGVGLISYSLYLWHWPLIAFAKYMQYTDMSLAYRVSIVGLSIILAIVSWKLVECPIRERLFLESRRAVFQAGAMCAALSFAFGMWIHYSDGSPSRFSPEVLAYVNAGKVRREHFTPSIQDLQIGRVHELGNGPPNAPVYCLLWGDSHAAAVAPAIEALAAKHNARCAVVTRGATAPLIGFVSGLIETRDSAPALNAAVIDYIRDNQVKNIVLVAHWAGYPDSNGMNPNRKIADALRDTVIAIKSTGATAWVMLDVPEYQTEVPRALARISMLRTSPLPFLKSVDEHQTEVARSHDFILSASDLGASVLDPAPFLSDSSGYCLVEMEGKSLYSDRHHLSKLGASLLEPLFEPIFDKRSPKLPSLQTRSDLTIPKTPSQN